MPLYTKDSLDLLRQRIDLAEVIGAHIDLKRAGAAYKALCPFHEEKTPSFMIQKGDSHYHCFGCGAHGDAIAFLMGHLRLGFTEAVESLADKFGVALEREESSGEHRGPSRTELKDALEKAARFYHFSLLYSEDGQQALHYLYKRGLDLDFIQQFQVGYAPAQPGIFQPVMKAQNTSPDILEAAGLVSVGESGRRRDFFYDRITFPIRDAAGAVIGFSARKFKEETFGGKYINTPETPLFKKSHVLFGLSYCRRRIAKERKAIIVEGQIDALRLIHAGLNFTVAGQGTAFGEGHAKELLALGVNHVLLALDGDEAGREAAVKIGDLFQKKGAEVSIVPLPDGKDPDAYLRENGPDAFAKLLDSSADYLSFLVARLSKKIDPATPSGKNELVRTIADKVRAWEQPVMVHESLRKLAVLLSVPEAMIGVEAVQPVFLRRSEGVSFSKVDPDRILEADLLRWLFLMGSSLPHICEIARKNVRPEYLRVEICRRLFEMYLAAVEKNLPRDLLSFASGLEKEEDQAILSEIMERKVNLQKTEEGIVETVRKILERQWMHEREAVKGKILSGKISEEEAMELAKEFDRLKKNRPEVVL